MNGIVLVFLCLAIGVLLQKNRLLKSNGPFVLNQFVIHASLPAMALYYIPQIDLHWGLIYPVAVAWLSFGFSWLFFSSLSKLFGWSRKLTGCLIVVCGLGNTSFVGFPIIEALYGQSGLQTALLIDQPGTFVVMSTLGIFVASLYSRGTVSLAEIGKRMVKFPPLCAFFIAFFIALMGWSLPEMVSGSLQKLAATVTPVALVAVGLQLQMGQLGKHAPFLSLGLAFKLFILPLVIGLLYAFGFQVDRPLLDVCVMEAAMAPMITGAIVASTHGLKPKLCAQLIGFGIPLSFVTLGIWYFILNHI